MGKVIDQPRFFLGLRGERLQNAQIWAVILPAYIIFGYNNAQAGGLLNLRPWVSTFPAIDTVTTTGATKTENSKVQGTVVALYTLGAFFGSLTTIFIGDKLGRIKTIQLGAAVTIIGDLLQASSFSLAQLSVGRLILGLGFGALSATAPNWQSECTGAKHRGSAVLFESVFISLGLAISGWLELGMSFTANSATPSVSWRFPLAFPAVFAFIVIAVIQFFPESPRWLAKHGRMEEAKQALSALEDADPESEVVTSQFAEIEESLRVSGQASFRDIFTNGEQRLLHRTCLAVAGQAFQQLSGINALAAYQSTIFEDYLGFNSVQALIIAASVFSWQTICSPIGVLTVDRFGRRKLMLVSAAGMGSCMAIIAGTSSQGLGDKAAIIVSAIFIFLFSLFFPTGFLGLTFLFAAEVAPLSVRVPITAVSTGSAWIFNFLVAEITPTGFDGISWRYFIIYACLNFLLILPSVYFFFPETAGRQLEEVDQIFRDSKNIFEPVRVARARPKGFLEENEQSNGEKEQNGLHAEKTIEGSSQ